MGKDEYKGNKGKTPKIAWDFDGVIHDYKHGWLGVMPTEPPKEGCEDALKKVKELGWNQVILSSRPKEYIKLWLEKYNLAHYFSGIYNHKITATIYVDDRGYRFEKWNEIDTIIEIVKSVKSLEEKI